MGMDKELIDKLLGGYKGREELIGEQGLLKQLTKEAGGAGDERRADPSPGLRKARHLGS